LDFLLRRCHCTITRVAYARSRAKARGAAAPRACFIESDQEAPLPSAPEKPP
jgi:hypothetical protein